MLREWLIQVPDNFFGKVYEMGGPDKYLVMVSMKSVRDRAGVRKFAERFPLAFKSDRVSLHGLIQELTHERNDRAGIKASAQVGSYRHVAAEV